MIARWALTSLVGLAGSRALTVAGTLTISIATNIVTSLYMARQTGGEQLGVAAIFTLAGAGLLYVDSELQTWGSWRDTEGSRTDAEDRLDEQWHRYMPHLLVSLALLGVGTWLMLTQIGAHSK